MGPRKTVARLTELHPELEWPAPSTVGDILTRAQLVQHRRRRNPPAHPLRARTTATAPNDLMTIDYKGQLLLRNRRYCYPLTMVDYLSRFILACDAFTSTEYAHTRRSFERVFRTYGLPRAILSDNGSPFDLPVWDDFLASHFGGSGSGSASNASSPAIPNRTALTNACMRR